MWRILEPICRVFCLRPCRKCLSCSIGMIAGWGCTVVPKQVVVLVEADRRMVPTSACCETERICLCEHGISCLEFAEGGISHFHISSFFHPTSAPGRAGNLAGKRNSEGQTRSILYSRTTTRTRAAPPRREGAYSLRAGRRNQTAEAAAIHE